MDLVIVDLYPFEATVASGASHADIIEKIDIGGISLIRAAAKNYQDVVIIPSKNQYKTFLQIIQTSEEGTTLEERKAFAASAFEVSSHYDTHIFNYFNQGERDVYKASISEATVLRYGENPHQKGVFYGDLMNLGWLIIFNNFELVHLWYFVCFIINLIRSLFYYLINIL